MKPIRVTAKCYRTWGELDVTLPTGLYAITGENGAGKSSIVNVIELALFGGALASHWNGDGVMEVCCEFEHRGATYRARRQYDGKGRGKSLLDFERAGREVLGEEGAEPWEIWEPLTRQSIAETEKAIVDTIGLTRETFRASAFLAQGDSAAFTEAQPRERKAILAEILGLELWDVLLERSRIDRRLAEDAVAGARAKLEGLESEILLGDGVKDELVEVGASLVVAQLALTTGEELLVRLSDEYREARDKTAEVLAARATVEGLAAKQSVFTEKSERAVRAEREIVAAEARQQEADVEAGKLPELEQKLDIAKNAQAAYELEVRTWEWAVKERDRQKVERALEEKIAAESDRFAAIVREKIATLKSEHEAKCELCGQTIAGQARSQTVAAYQEEIVAHEDKANHHRKEAASIEISADPEPLPLAPPVTTEIADLTAAIEKARGAQRESAALQVRLEQSRALVAEVETPEFVSGVLDVSKGIAEAKTLVEVLMESIGEVDIEAIKAAGAKARVDRDASATQVQQLGARKGGLEERHKRLQAALEQHDTVLEQSEAALHRIDVFKAAERSYGRDGIPALIIESAAVPQIEKVASDLLDRLGTDLRVELRTQREKKSGNGVSEALDIVILDPQGRERLYEHGCSGGEKTRVNVALRIALALLLAHRKGAEVQLLTLDEPENLDDKGVERLLATLETLVEDFGSICVISHLPSLRNSIGQSLQVVKRDGRSELVAA